MTVAERSLLRRCAVACVAPFQRSHLRPGIAQTPEDRATAQEIVAAADGDTLAYFALRGDRSWFFAENRKAVLAYTDVGRLAYVSGDPIGDPLEFGRLVGEFKAFARSRKQRVVVMAASEAVLPVMAEAGMTSLYVGDEAVVDPQGFSLRGRSMRSVRQAVNRVVRAGYTLDIVAPGQIDAGTRAQMRDLSQEWRRGQPERGFTMMMDALFRYPDTHIAIARDAAGRVGGFVQVLPSGLFGYSLASQRRRLDAPNGLTEFMLAGLIEWARERGGREFSLNFASLGRYLRQERGPVHWALDQAERLVPMRRLQRFNDKFSPQWRPRYVSVERVTDLPAAGFACGRLEGYIPSRRTAGKPDLTAA